MISGLGLSSSRSEVRSYYSLSSKRLVDIKITKFYVEKVPGDFK
jgi:hypothetical protein